MKKARLRGIAAALLAMSLLSGCGGSSSTPAVSGSPHSKVPEVMPSGGLTITRDEDYARTLQKETETRLSDMAFQSGEISADAGTKLEEEIFLSEQKRVDASVKARNWSDYATDYTYDRLSEREKELWRRLRATAEDYMNNSALDASYVREHDTWMTYGSGYSDLGLSMEEAGELVTWFRYSNPQYWFLSSQFLYTSDKAYLCIYPIAAKGSDRANITNSIFHLVDGWADSLPRGASSYEKTAAMHSRICDALEYVHGDYDQSIYSTFIQGETVCAGYAGGMTVLLNAADVSAVTVTSNTHAWNAVRMNDGAWYGEDATWGDSAGDLRFFLVSDQQLKAQDNSREAHDPEPAARKWAPALSDQNYDPASAKAPEPSAPACVRVQFVDEDTARAIWSAVPDAEGYEVELLRGDSSIGSGSTSDTWVKIAGVPLDTVTVRVRAAAGGNRSPWTESEYTHGYYLPPAAEKPSSEYDSSVIPEEVPAPENVEITETGEDFVSLSWDSDPDTECEIAVFLDRDGRVLLQQQTVDGGGCTIGGLTNRQTVYFRLRAVSTAGGVRIASPWVDTSAKVGVDPASQAEPPHLTAPENLSYIQLDKNSVRLTWNPVDRADAYFVEVYEDAAHLYLDWEGSAAGCGVRITGIPAGGTRYVKVYAAADWKGKTVVSECAEAAISLSEDHPWDEPAGGAGNDPTLDITGSGALAGLAGTEFHAARRLPVAAPAAPSGTRQQVWGGVIANVPADYVLSAEGDYLTVSHPDAGVKDEMQLYHKASFSMSKKALELSFVQWTMSVMEGDEIECGGYTLHFITGNIRGGGGELLRVNHYFIFKESEMYQISFTTDGTDHRLAVTERDLAFDPAAAGP